MVDSAKEIDAGWLDSKMVMYGFFFSYLWHFFYIHTMGEMQLFSLIRLVSFLGVKVAKYRHILIFFVSGVVGVTADHHVLP